MSESTDEDVIPTFQPHFDYDDWKKDKKPSGDERSNYLAKGFDIFATKGYFYIVRSDLDRPLFMKIDDLHNPTHKGKIYDLPQAFEDGDHYFGDSGIKYVVHGDIIHATDDLQTDSTPSPATAFDIPTTIEGSNVTMTDVANHGMHYVVHKGTMYRIGCENAFICTDIYVHPSHYTDPQKGDPIPIHEKLQKGICYFALSDYFYVMKMVDTGNGREQLCYYKVKDLRDDPGLGYRTVNKSIQLFLPGGYTIDNPANPQWEAIGYFKNESDIASDYIHEFKYSHGSSKTETDTLENHWEVEFKQEVGVSVLVAKASASASEKYGGSDTHTTTDQWQESTEETISFQIHLESGKGWVLWQPTIKLGGSKTLVAGKYVVATNDGDLPEDDPWA